jgi:hypothetical protein
MRIVVSVLLAACSLAATGCDDKKPEAKPAATAAPPPAPATATAAAPAKTATPGGW